MHLVALIYQQKRTDLCAEVFLRKDVRAIHEKGLRLNIDELFGSMKSGARRAQEKAVWRRTTAPPWTSRHVDTLTQSRMCVNCWNNTAALRHVHRFFDILSIITKNRKHWLLQKGQGCLKKKQTKTKKLSQKNWNNYVEKQTKGEILRKTGFILWSECKNASVKKQIYLLYSMIGFNLFGICGCLCLLTSLRFV